MFFHGKTTDGRRFTIAGKFTRKSPLHSIKLLLGASLCSNNDCFIKKVGRYKAEGRLESTNTKGKLKLKEFEFIEDKPISSFNSAVSTFNNLNSKDFQVKFNLYRNG